MPPFISRVGAGACVTTPSHAWQTNFGRRVTITRYCAAITSSRSNHRGRSRASPRGSRDSWCLPGAKLPRPGANVPAAPRGWPGAWRYHRVCARGRASLFAPPIVRRRSRCRRERAVIAPRATAQIWPRIFNHFELQQQVLQPLILLG